MSSKPPRKTIPRRNASLKSANNRFLRMSRAVLHATANMNGTTLARVQEDVAKRLGIPVDGNGRYTRLENMLRGMSIRPDALSYDLARMAATSRPGTRMALFSDEFIATLLSEGNYKGGDVAAIQNAVAQVTGHISTARPSRRSKALLPEQRVATFVQQSGFDALANALKKQSAVVYVYGPNGSGKTVLVREVAHEAADGHPLLPVFDAFAWVSNEPLTRREDEQQRGNIHDITLGTVLDRVAMSLQAPAIAVSAVSFDEKLRRVSDLLAGQRVLVVVNDFDAIRASNVQRDIERWLVNLPAGSKAIVTCSRPAARGAFRDQTTHLAVSPLTEAEATQLIDQWLGRFDASLAERAAIALSLDERQRLIQEARGMPGNILTILRAIQREPQTPLTTHLSRMKAGVKGPNFPALHQMLRVDWGKLSLSEQYILKAATLCPQSVSFEALQEIHRSSVLAPSEDFDYAIRELQVYGLLEVTRGPAQGQSRRFEISSGVRKFVVESTRVGKLANRDLYTAWVGYFHNSALKLGRDEWDEPTMDRVYQDIDNFERVLRYCQHRLESEMNGPVATWAAIAHALIDMVLVLRQYWAVRGNHEERLFWLRTAREVAQKLGDWPNFVIAACALVRAESHADQVEEAKTSLASAKTIIESLQGTVPSPVPGAPLLVGMTTLSHSSTSANLHELQMEYNFAQLILLRNTASNEEFVAQAQKCYVQSQKMPLAWGTRFRYAYARALVDKSDYDAAYPVLVELTKALQSYGLQRYQIAARAMLAECERDTLTALQLVNDAWDMAIRFQYPYRLGEIKSVEANIHRRAGDLNSALRAAQLSKEWYERAGRLSRLKRAEALYEQLAAEATSNAAAMNLS